MCVCECVCVCVCLTVARSFWDQDLATLACWRAREKLRGTVSSAVSKYARKECTYMYTCS